MRIIVLILLLTAVPAEVFGYSSPDMLKFRPQPTSYDEKTPEYVDIGTNGVRIAAIVYEHKYPQKALLRCHGHAEDAANTLEKLKKLNRYGCTVAAVDYPGYGLSDGKPDEEGCYRNVHRLYDWLVEVKGFKAKDIIVDGFSIGTGPAIELASTRPVGGLLLEAAYLSAARSVTEDGILPIDSFPNFKRIVDVKCPVVFLHGDRDSIIPHEQGARLYVLAGEPKRFVTVEGADHNDLIDVYGVDEYLALIRKEFSFSRYVTTSIEGDTTLGEDPDYNNDLDYGLDKLGDEDGLDREADKADSFAEIAELIHEIAGEVRIDGHFVKLARPFFGFPWMRIETVYAIKGPSTNGCGAEMTFETTEPSDFPLRKIKALQDYMVGKMKLELVRETNGANSYSALARSNGVKYKFYMHSEVGKRRFGGKRYTIGFSAKPIIGRLEWRQRPDRDCHADWNEVVHETFVDKVDDENAWRYEIKRGKSSEELLDEYVEQRDSSILKNGHTKIGMCIGSGTNAYTACTEFEAEFYNIHCGCYTRGVDRATQMRLYNKLTQPDAFRKGRTKPAYGCVGEIFWEVIPGDKITWYEAEKRNRIGIVVRDDEEGEYWEPIKAKVKVTVDEELATKEDWEPTALTKEYDAKRKEVLRKHDGFRRKGAKEDMQARMLEITSSLVPEMRPGYYHPITTYNIADFSTPTKEYVRRKLLWRESDALNDWQYELRDVRCRVLSEFQGLHRTSSRVRPDAETVREWGLSREEDYMLRCLPGWHMLKYEIDKYVIATDFGGIGFRPVHDRMPMPDHEGVLAFVAELKKLAAIEHDAKTYFWQDERVLSVCRALELILENPESSDAEALEKAVLDVIKAHPSGGAMEPLCAKIALEYGEDPRSWRILRAMNEFADNGLKKTLKKIFESKWYQYCQGHSEEVEIPVGCPYDYEAVSSRQSDFVRKQVIPIPSRGETNAFVYVYWNTKTQTSRVRFYSRWSKDEFRADYDAERDVRSLGEKRVFSSFEWKDSLNVPRFRLRWMNPDNGNEESVDYKVLDSGVRREY